MTMPFMMRFVINIGTFGSFFLLIFFLINYINRVTYLEVLSKTLCSVIFVHLCDFFISSELEEGWLFLAAIGILLWTFGIFELKQFKQYVNLIIAIILSYIIVILSTILTSLLLIAYEKTVLNITDMTQVKFSWLMVILIICGQLLLAASLGLLVKRVFRFIKVYAELYGIRITITVAMGLAFFVSAVIILYDEFFEAGIPTEYLYLVLGIILILLTLVIVGMLFYAQVIIRQNKDTLEQENQKNLSMYVDQLERNYREIRKFRHDIANALLALETIINERGDSSLTADFHTLLAHYHFDVVQNKAIGQFQEINNAYLKGIIFSKYIEAHNNRIPFNLEVQANLFEEKKQYFDELRLLGIFLDNAIEAVHQQGTGEITVSLFEQAQKTVYRIKNTFQEPVAFGKIYQSGYSTKGPDRGIGLATAKEITDARDDFRLVLKQEDHDFVAMLVVELEEDND